MPNLGFMLVLFGLGFLVLARVLVLLLLLIAMLLPKPCGTTVAIGNQVASNELHRLLREDGAMLGSPTCPAQPRRCQATENCTNCSCGYLSGGFSSGLASFGMILFLQRLLD